MNSPLTSERPIWATWFSLYVGQTHSQLLSLSQSSESEFSLEKEIRGQICTEEKKEFLELISFSLRPSSFAKIELLHNIEGQRNALPIHATYKRYCYAVHIDIY